MSTIIATHWKDIRSNPLIPTIIHLGIVEATGSTYYDVTTVEEALKGYLPGVREADVHRVFDVYIVNPNSYTIELYLVYGDSKNEYIIIYIGNHDAQDNLQRTKKAIENWRASVNKRAAEQAVALAQAYYLKFPNTRH